MIETQEKLINGATYTVTQLPARRAIRLKAKLIKLFGPTLAQIFIGMAKDDQSSHNFVLAIESLSANLDENVFEALCVEILNGVRKNGIELNPSVIDLEFAGDMASLYQALWFVIEVNYSNFFEMLGTGSQFAPSIQPSTKTTDTKKTYTRN